MQPALASPPPLGPYVPPPLLQKKKERKRKSPALPGFLSQLTHPLPTPYGPPHTTPLTQTKSQSSETLHLQTSTIPLFSLFWKHLFSSPTLPWQLLPTTYSRLSSWFSSILTIPSRHTFGWAGLSLTVSFEMAREDSKVLGRGVFFLLQEAFLTPSSRSLTSTAQPVPLLPFLNHCHACLGMAHRFMLWFQQRSFKVSSRGSVTLLNGFCITLTLIPSQRGPTLTPWLWLMASRKNYEKRDFSFNPPHVVWQPQWVGSFPFT